MTPFLSFIVLLLILFGIVTALINTVRRYNNTSVTLRWVLIPLFISLAALFVNLYVDNSEWNIKNLVIGSGTPEQDSLQTVNNILSDALKQTEDKGKTVKKSKTDIKESESKSETLTAAEQDPGQTDKKLTSVFISPDQRRRFINYLKDEPKGKIRIQYISGDKQAFEYAGFIADMLTEAGYTLSGEISDFTGNPAVDGISIVINRNETEPRYARSIFFAFRSIGINITAERNKQAAKPLEVLITVGHQR